MLQIFLHKKSLGIIFFKYYFSLMTHNHKLELEILHLSDVLHLQSEGGRLFSAPPPMRTQFCPFIASM